MTFFSACFTIFSEDGVRALGETPDAEVLADLECGIDVFRSRKQAGSASLSVART